MPTRGYEFIFRVFNSYLTIERSEYEKIKYLSTSKHVNNKIKESLAISRRFPNILRRCPKMFLKFSEDCPKFTRTLPIIFPKFPKMSEDYRRLPNISEQFLKMF